MHCTKKFLLSLIWALCGIAPLSARVQLSALDANTSFADIRNSYEEAVVEVVMQKVPVTKHPSALKKTLGHYWAIHTPFIKNWYTAAERRELTAAERDVKSAIEEITYQEWIFEADQRDHKAAKPFKVATANLFDAKDSKNNLIFRSKLVTGMLEVFALNTLSSRAREKQTAATFKKLLSSLREISATFPAYEDEINVLEAGLIEFDLHKLPFLTLKTGTAMLGAAATTAAVIAASVMGYKKARDMYRGYTTPAIPGLPAADAVRVNDALLPALGALRRVPGLENIPLDPAQSVPEQIEQLTTALGSREEDTIRQVTTELTELRNTVETLEASAPIGIQLQTMIAPQTVEAAWNYVTTDGLAKTLEISGLSAAPFVWMPALGGLGNPLAWGSFGITLYRNYACREKPVPPLEPNGSNAAERQRIIDFNSSAKNVSNYLLIPQAGVGTLTAINFAGKAAWNATTIIPTVFGWGGKALGVVVLPLTAHAAVAGIPLGELLRRIPQVEAIAQQIQTHVPGSTVVKRLAADTAVGAAAYMPVALLTQNLSSLITHAAKMPAEGIIPSGITNLGSFTIGLDPATGSYAFTEIAPGFTQQIAPAGDYTSLLGTVIKGIGEIFNQGLGNTAYLATAYGQFKLVEEGAKLGYRVLPDGSKIKQLADRAAAIVPQVNAPKMVTEPLKAVAAICIPVAAERIGIWPLQALPNMAEAAGDYVGAGINAVAQKAETACWAVNTAATTLPYFAQEATATVGAYFEPVLYYAGCVMGVFFIIAIVYKYQNQIMPAAKIAQTFGKGMWDKTKEKATPFINPVRNKVAEWIRPVPPASVELD